VETEHKKQANNPLNPVAVKNYDTVTPTNEKIEQLVKLVESIGLCMFVTRNKEGSLVSRAMSPRKPSLHGVHCFYFFSNNMSQKDFEVDMDPNVNLSFISTSTREWISISGEAKHVKDTTLKQMMWDTDIIPWLGDLKDGIHDGTINDPRLALIEVTTKSVRFSVKEDPEIVRMFNVVKGMFTGEAPKVSSDKELTEQELHGHRLTTKV